MFGELSMLWWGAAAAVPILIHLFARQRYKRVPWAAMEFLRRAFQKTRKRIRIENLLLLVLRVMALLLLALALADPKLENPLLNANRDSRREVVIVLDDSYSMDFREASGETPFRRAHEGAQRLVRMLNRDRGDTATLISAGRPASLILTRDSNLDRVAAEIGKREISDSATDLIGAMRTVVALLADLPKGVEVFLFTDLQKVAFMPEESSTPAGHVAAEEKKPAQILSSLINEIKTKGALLTLVAAPTAEADNLAVTDLSLASKVATVGEPLRFVATIRNFGRRPASGVVNLFVDGAGAGADSQPVELMQPGATQVVDFRYVFRDAGPHYLDARFTTDSLEIDNSRTLSIDVRERFDALIVDGSPNPVLGEEASFFLNAALEIGGANRPGIFGVRTVTEVAFDHEGLADVELLALVNVANLSARRAKEVEEFVARGGGLLVFLGDRTQPATLNDLLYRNGEGVLPAAIDAPMGEVGTKLVAYEFKPVVLDRAPFRYFADERIRGALLGMPIVYRFFTTRLPESVPAGFSPPAVLAQYVSRKAEIFAPVPAVLEKRSGAGRTILVTTTADRSWNEMAVLPAYVPFIREMAYHLVRRPTSWENIQVGDSYRREIDRFVREVVVEKAGKQVQVVRPIPIEGRASFEVKVDTLDHAGVFRLTYAEDGEAGKKPMLPTYLAVNVDPREADLTRLSPEAIAANFPADALRLVASIEEKAPGEAGPGESAWWWIVWVVLITLAGETILGQLFGRSNRGGAALT